MRAPTPVAMKPGDQPNHLELSCVHSTRTGLVNGKQVVQAVDTAYADGHVLLGVVVSQGLTLASDGRFANLVITQQ
jgi:hypothetical protein